MEGELERGRTLPLTSNVWLLLEKLLLKPWWVMLTASPLPLWFEQEDRKAMAPRLPMASLPQEDTRSSDQPRAHDSISGGLAGTHDRTLILTRCFYTTFMPAVEEQLVSDQASSQLVLNYIIQLFFSYFLFLNRSLETGCARSNEVGGIYLITKPSQQKTVSLGGVPAQYRLNCPSDLATI